MLLPQTTNHVINNYHQIKQNPNHAERKSVDNLRNNLGFIMKETEKVEQFSLWIDQTTFRRLKDNL